jgi:Histidine-specific methyltransferase, SAM-dependent
MDMFYKRKGPGTKGDVGQIKRPKPSPKGIKDWKLKLEALKAIFDVETNVDLVAAVMGDAITTDEADTQDRIADSFRTWDKSNPTGDNGRLFLAALQARLREKGFAEYITSRRGLLRSSYSEFCAQMPSSMAGLPVALPEVQPINPETTSRNLGVQLYQLWVPTQPFAEGTKVGLERGKIDHKSHYLTPAAAEVWSDIINGGHYRLYHYCCDSMRSVMTLPVWKDFVRSPNTLGAVMLGAGAPLKDHILLSSMVSANPSREMIYQVIDYSSYMLKGSLTNIAKSYSEAMTDGRLSLKLIEWDFTQLSRIKRVLRPRDGALVWMLPGGTIGNLDEKQFLNSVKSVACPGDLLIIGAGLRPESVGDTSNTPEAQYKSAEVLRLVQMPLRAVWHDLGISGDIHDALKALEFRYLIDEKNEYSKVDKAATLEMSLMADDQKIVLMTSTRYAPNELIKFVERYGFSFEASVPSQGTDAGDVYHQFIFRCTGRISN